MVVMILGFSKSGTTLTAKTLHAAGINFGDITTGNYPGSPYEDPSGCDVIMKSFGIEQKKSLFIPDKIDYDEEEIKSYITMRSIKSKDWGFKFPYLTYVYGVWKKFLPPHTWYRSLLRTTRATLPGSPLTATVPSLISINGRVLFPYQTA